MRFTAPADTTAAFLSSGPLAVESGILTVPDDANQGDLAGLAANGFTLASAEAPKVRAGTLPPTEVA